MYNSSGLPPRPRGLRERIHSSDAGSIAPKLPEAAQVLANVLQDEEVLVQLLSAFGGRTVRIPTRWPPHGKDCDYQGHVLCAVLDYTRMQYMVRHYAGTDVYIPKCTKYLAALRNNSIVRAFSQATRAGRSSGEVVQSLAERYYLSDRRIWGILKTTVLQEDCRK